MNTQLPTRVVIADDHTIFRQALRALIAFEAGLKVVGEAANGTDAVRLTRHLRPAILLLDIAMPGLSGLAALRELSTSRESTRVVVLAASIERAQLMEALRLGARGIVLKESSTDVLFKCLRAVIAGDYWVDGMHMENLVQFFRATPRGGHSPEEAFGLTARELQVVSAVVAGSTNKDVSRRLSVSAQTVKHHLYNIFGKLGVANRTELALFAYSHQLVENPFGPVTWRSPRARAEGAVGAESAVPPINTGTEEPSPSHGSFPRH